MSRVAVRCAAVGISTALLAAAGGAPAYGSPALPGSSASRAARPRPPKLRAGETWSYVIFELRATVPHCDSTFGHVGTQTCDGHYEPNDYPNPQFGGWGFTAGHNGTTRSTRKQGETLMTVNFFTPGAEILGTIPDEASNRYTITSSQGPGGWRIDSPAESPDYDKTAPGTKGGPLRFRVERTYVGSEYYLKAQGWVVVTHSARHRNRPRPRAQRQAKTGSPM